MSVPMTSRCVLWFMPLLLSPLPLACPTREREFTKPYPYP